MANNLGSAGNGGKAKTFSVAQQNARNAGNAIEVSSGDLQGMYDSGYVQPEGKYWSGKQGRVMEGISERPGRMMDEQATIAGTSFFTTDTAEEIRAKREALEELGLTSRDTAFNYLPDLTNPKQRATYERQQDRYENDIDSGRLEAHRVFAGLLDVPTSTTNYSRPRTVAAGWSANGPDTQLGTLTVVFRDGTPYNFYDVPYSSWIKFHQSISKGKPYLNSTFPKEFKHGPADVSSLPEDVRGAIMDGVYQAARLKQIYYRTPKTGKGHYTTIQTAKKVLTKRDRPVLVNGVPKINNQGYYVVNKRIRTMGAAQGPYKGSANPAENRRIAKEERVAAQAKAAAAQKAKANKAPKRNTSAQRKK